MIYISDVLPILTKDWTITMPEKLIQQKIADHSSWYIKKNMIVSMKLSVLRNFTKQQREKEN